MKPCASKEAFLWSGITSIQNKICNDIIVFIYVYFGIDHRKVLAREYVIFTLVDIVINLRIYLDILTSKKEERVKMGPILKKITLLKI